MKAAVVLCLVFISVTLAYRQPKCRGKEVHMSEEDLKGMAECMKEIAPEAADAENPDPMKANEKGKGKAITEEKMACLGKCILAKEMLIDEKGMPSKDSMMSKINSTMPEEVMEDLDKAIAKCVEDSGKLVKPDEKDCKSYVPLVQCMHMSLIEVCKEKKKM